MGISAGDLSKACVVCASVAILLIAAFGDVRADSSTMVVETDTDGVQRAAVTMDSYSYHPQHLIVQAGKPVELSLTSVTLLTPHNFVLQDAAAGLAVQQDVGAGKTLTVRFTPVQAGLFTFYCDKKLLFFASHREKGMEGRLEVR
jgi:plastocyanin